MNTSAPDASVLDLDEPARALQVGDKVWVQAKVVEEDGGLYFEPRSRAQWFPDDGSDLSAYIARQRAEARREALEALLLKAAATQDVGFKTSDGSPMHLRGTNVASAIRALLLEPSP